MNVAFYAPLKSPDNPVPSGDRLIGRMLVRAIEAGGHQVKLVSELRSLDRSGSGARQRRIQHVGSWEAARVLKRLRQGHWKPDLWLTYHLYHKAPDWLGPEVAPALGIPYCVAEASSSPRAADGPWRLGHHATAAALNKAALVIGLNPKDEPGIRPLVAPATRLLPLAPFIDGAPFRAGADARSQHRRRLAAAYALDTEVPWLLAVGMLRSGDKSESYAILADALAAIDGRRWHLIVAGGGAAAAEIISRFSGLRNRVYFTGEVTGDTVAALMAASDALVWPAVNEAIGMVFVEAAMAGLPVVGASRSGIAAIVADGVTGFLVPERNAAAFAAAIARLLDDPNLCRTLGRAAANRALTQHDLAQASTRLCRALEAVAR
jgi:glycosyltransferase involved in cell wall biosynthesis